MSDTLIASVSGVRGIVGKDFTPEFVARYAAAFGFILAMMGCYHGYHSGRGAQGVGRATTNAVVASSILILAANYLLTEAFF